MSMFKCSLEQEQLLFRLCTVPSTVRSGVTDHLGQNVEQGCCHSPQSVHYKPRNLRVNAQQKKKSKLVHI